VGTFLVESLAAIVTCACMAVSGGGCGPGRLRCSSKNAGHATWPAATSSSPPTEPTPAATTLAEIEPAAHPGTALAIPQISSHFVAHGVA
jgi:hypothetical protein